jgi:hypothetical protein
MHRKKFSALTLEAVRSGTIFAHTKLFFARAQVRGLRALTKAPVFSNLFERAGGQWGSFGFFFRGTYFVCHQAGFFSTISGVAQDLILQSGRHLRVSSTFGLHLYKRYFWTDNWSKFFETTSNAHSNPESTQSSGANFSELWNSSYAELDISQLSEVSQRWFKPSREVWRRRSQILRDYGIKPSGSLGIHFRATDKVSELPTPSLSQVQMVVDAVLLDSPNLRLVVLTDDSAFASAFGQLYPETVFLTDLPYSSMEIGAHFLDGKNREEQGLIFFASVLLISQCEKVITHTGNGGLWEVIFRGSSKGVSQLRGESRV